MVFPIFDIITNIYSWKKEPPPIEYSAYDYLHGNKGFKKIIEERKRRFTNYNYCEVDFEFEYKGVKIKTNRTFNFDKDNLKMKFALQAKIDIYISCQLYEEERLEIYDGNLIPQENIEYYPEEINFSQNCYYDGKYIYSYHLDFSFMNEQK